jgi:DNA-binding transcriptional ArsR family regulator
MSTEARDPPSARTLARLISHPLRTHVLFKYVEGVTSPSRIAAALHVPVNVVSYHTQVLVRAGALELVRTQPRRGAREHLYRAVLPADIEDAEWTELPVKLRRVLTRAVIDGSARESADALAAGGMDGAATHLSRSYFLLDEEGERELAVLLRQTLERANAIDRACRERHADGATPHELVVMSFQRTSRP